MNKYSFEHMKQDDGYYLDEKDISHKNAEEYLGYLLNFCGCGEPHTALLFVRKLLHELDTTNKNAWNDRYERLENFWDEAPIGAKYFTYYMLDHMELIEHGTTIIGCWLTEKGLTIMHDLDVYEEEYREENKDE